MICTLSPDDGERGRANAILATLMLTLGCLVAGGALFVALSVTGSEIWQGNSGPELAAIVVGISAAVLDVAGIRVIPQIRSQVPESWRHRVPMPLAGLAYGLLLGLGFTTFVMSYTLWGVALLALVVGSPALGVSTGVAFGLGRALPIVVLAPWADARWALAVQDSMSQGRVTLRAARILAGCMIGLAALGGSSSIAVASTAGVVVHGMDPSVDGSQLAYRTRDSGTASVFLTGLGGAAPVRLPGRLLAIGGGLAAELDNDVITVRWPGDSRPPVVLPAPPGVDALAVSDQWIAYHVAADPAAGRLFDLIAVRRADGSHAPRTIAAVSPPSELGRPALFHDRLAYHVSSRTRSRISVVDLQSGSLTSIQRTGAQLLFPSLDADAIAFVEVTDCREQLLLQQGGVVKVLARSFTRIRRDSGYSPGAARVGRTPMQCAGPRMTPAGHAMYWQTALADDAAYLTIIDAATPRSLPRIVAVPR
jgi:hypothetical protein